MNNFNDYRTAILVNLLSNKEPKIERLEQPKELKTQHKQDSLKLIRILQAVPQFVGDDLNIYGPFEEEYVASLPEKIADVLVKKNKAAVI